mmetsp:Transcript_31788/g.61510  ORF Transcript_31788/g.61510 Transcript_31788/m.61510 type:complete len:169 (-) Transcript_31788:15-521(-)
MAASSLSNTTAMVLCPPRDVWPAIDEIRNTHDKAASKWPPHVNLCFPFVPSHKFETRKVALEAKMARIPSFTITLDTFATVGTSKKKEGRRFICLVPNVSNSEALGAVKSALKSVFPECTPRVEVHLTVGQAKGEECPKLIEQFEKQWNRLTWTVDNVAFLEKTKSRF